MHHDDPTLPSGHRSPSGEEARFLPGTIVAKRFRIVAPLGRGGMGEVYRADDLRLGQAVALKFLPRSFEDDPARLARLLDEVRLARQVSHPNVCRVWDVGESEGQHFLAMEYVDGEDLDSLLRRIGRFPEDRGVQVAREICAGLAAVHDQGLVHRDLKPANIMLDGRGRVRIADFGIAMLSGGSGAAGTPAYMAPEQRTRGESSARSDLYSLGLVLHELFTGRKGGADPTSTHTSALDPAIEKTILSCLATDPVDRPASAWAVARALPGPEGLELVLAAGETPSPEMVAAAGGTGGLKPLVAAGLALLAIAAMLASLELSERRGLPFGPEDKPYAALRDRAEVFLRSIGPLPPGGDMMDGFSRVSAASAPAARDSVRRYFYWYRRSPGLIERVDDTDRAISKFARPPLEVPGEQALRLDTSGRLLEYHGVPDSTGTTGLGPFFLAAGLEGFERESVRPGADAESAWVVHAPAGRTRVEAGTRGGAITFFAVGEPYGVPPMTPADGMESLLGPLVTVSLMALALVFAFRNLRLGRADVRGAFRLSLVSGLMGMLGWAVLRQPQLARQGSYWFTGITIVLFYAVFMVSSYLALEPIVRRRHPEWLASWRRLLEGRFLDPLVGRDLMIGVVGGALIVLVGAALAVFELPPRNGDFQAAAVGGWPALGVVVRAVGISLTSSFVIVLLLVLSQMLARRPRLGWILWWPLASFYMVPSSTLPGLLVGGLRGLMIALLLRLGGLWSVAVALITFGMVNEEFVTTQIGEWYSGVSIAVLLTFFALLSWAGVAATRARATVR